MGKDLDRRRLITNSLWVGGLLLTGCRSDDDSAQLRGADEPLTADRMPSPPGFSPAAAQQAPAAVLNLKVRKAIHTLTATSPEVLALKAGIKAMKAKALTRFDSFTFQGNIHRNSCPHANWFFLPWHRMYLFWFEQHCRKASGNPEFSLPYWDWTADTRLPAFFYTDPVFADTTRVQRSGEGFPELLRRTNAGVSVQQARAFVDNIFGPAAIAKMMASTRFLEFGSARAATQRGNASFGALESGPNNNAHGFVGGNMGQVAVSPRDPIFWLHHCNIDRLWAMWAQGKGPNALPPNPAPGEAPPSLTTDFFRNFKLSGFTNLEGQPVAVAVSEVLDFMAMGYTYDTVRPSTTGLSLAADAGGPPAPSAMTDMAGVKMALPALALPEMSPQMGANSPPPKRLLNFQVALDPATLPALRTIQGGSSAFYPVARLAIGALPKPKAETSRVILTFYVRAATEAGAGEAQVGSFSFFTHVDAGHAHDDTVSMTFDLRGALAELQTKGVDVGRARSLEVGIDVLGLKEYKASAAAFSKVTVGLTCFQ